MNQKTLILIIEDEQSIANSISSILNSHGYKTMTCGTGKEGLTMAASHSPAAILLDLGLPDMDGNTVITTLRQWSDIPIIVISARIQEEDKVDALDYGADDYITKPFTTGELMARIRTALRHTIHAGNMKVFRSGELSIDFERHQVKVGEEDIHLTQIEYKIVALLAKNAGKVMTYDRIIKEIWGPYADNNNRILRVNMVNIRRKLEKNPAEPQYIYTEIGVGYRMSDEEPENTDGQKE